MSIDKLLIFSMKKKPGIIININNQLTAKNIYDNMMEHLSQFYEKKRKVIIPELFNENKKITAKIFEEAKVDVKYETENGFVKNLRVEQTGGEYYGYINIEHITNETPIPPSIQEDYPTRWGTKVEELFLVYFDVAEKGNIKQRTQERDEFVNYLNK